MAHVSWGINFCELAKIRHYGGINFAEVGEKIVQNGYMTGKKIQNVKKIASTFPNEGNQKISRQTELFKFWKS